MKKKKSLNILNVAVFVLNIVCAAALLFSYLTGVSFLEKFSLINYLGLIYPYLLFINILFLFYWLIQWHRYLWMSLIVILIGFNFLPRLYQVSFSKEEKNVDSLSIKVMSYNVQVFGAFHADTENRDSIIRFLQQENPDIICFQEYYENKNTKRQLSTAEHLKDLKANHKHISLQGISGKFGIATFSKYPIVNKGIVPFLKEGANKAIFTDIVVDKDTIRVYNVHFQSLHFDEKDYLFASNAINLSDKDLKKNSKRILRKLNKGFKLRNSQTDKFIQHVEQSPFPFIICGDFNDTPYSSTYKKINKLSKDSFVESGKGFGNTFHINNFLAFRIDYIFHDNCFESQQFTVTQSNASDHYPIYTLIKKKKK